MDAAGRCWRRATPWPWVRRAAICAAKGAEEARHHFTAGLAVSAAPHMQELGKEKAGDDGKSRPGLEHMAKSAARAAKH